MSTTHTQGQHVAKYNFASNRHAPNMEVRDLGGYLLAIVPRKGRKYADARPQAEQEANAALFATASELLAALVALLEQADLGEVDEETQPIVDQARAAIAKATGENI